MLQPHYAVCIQLPRPATVEVAEAELPIDGCGPPVFACEPLADLCADAATWLQPACHNQEVLNHQADVKTPQV